MSSPNRPPGNNKYKLSGNALVITVIVALVIGIICTLIILAAYNNLQIRSDLNIGRKLDRNLQSGVRLVLSGNPEFGKTQTSTTDLFGTGADTISIREETWGMYDVASVESQDGGRTKRKTFFFGSLLPPKFDGCLFLAEHQRSLSLVGSTKLTGKAYLPKAGVKAGYVDQRGYAYSDLIDGPTERSDSLPVADQGRLRYYAAIYRKDSAVKGSDIIPDSLHRSFADTLQTIHGKGVLTLSSVILSGHILITSDSVIEVNADAQLNDILLSAPAIIFHKGFAGKVQAFGSDSIVVEDNCSLGYPSAVILVKKEGNIDQPKMVIGENCLVEGLALSFSQDDKSRTYTKLGKNSIIRGVLYSCGFLELKGIVYGTVLTDFFISRTTSVIYENYLVDAQIDRGRLPWYFAAPPIFTGPKKNKILQWVK